MQVGNPGAGGADSVDVAAATARHIPVTNVPDTFIEEVADHVMMLLLATFRRLTTMDKFVRAGRWREGRPVYLCWKYGETEVTHWHAVGRSFEDRQRLFKEDAAKAPVELN